MREAGLLLLGRRPSRTVKTRSDARGPWLAVVAVAIILAVVGTGLFVRRQSAAPLATTATLGGLTVRLRDAGWLSMDGMNHQQGGYQMPAQMMPGAPEGDDMRFGVPLTLVNTSNQVRQFNLADEFLLRGGRLDTPRVLHSDTFGLTTRLAPGSAIDGVLYFDTIVPGGSDPPLYLLWQRDGTTKSLAIPLMVGDSPGHGHSP